MVFIADKGPMMCAYRLPQQALRYSSPLKECKAFKVRAWRRRPSVTSRNALGDIGYETTEKESA